MKKINLLETLESRQLLAANNEAASDFLHTETESLLLQIMKLSEKAVTEELTKSRQPESLGPIQG